MTVPAQRQRSALGVTLAELAPPVTNSHRPSLLPAGQIDCRVICGERPVSALAASLLSSIPPPPQEAAFQSRRDRDLEHSIALVREEVIGGFDLIQLKPVGHHRAQVDAS
jgi:hypothetical protein